jgi:hypothetical protein
MTYTISNPKSLPMRYNLTAMFRVLAENSPGGDVTGVILWCAVLFVIAMVGLLLAIAIKRSLSRREQSTINFGFTLEDLEAMYKEGKISDQEYQRAKGRMVASLRAAASSSPASPRRSG